MFMKPLVDISTGAVVPNVKLLSPLVNTLFAPFFDFPSYFLTLPYPKAQLLSWIAWLCTIWVLLTVRKLKGPTRKKILPILRGLFVTVVSFILFIVYCILCPLPQNRIISQNPDEVFLDLHSHTIYSHDGIITPERNLHWHINAGFSIWATTEHDYPGKSQKIQQELIKKKSIAAVAIPGQEVNFKKVHLNLLGIKENIDHKKYKDIADIIEDVHIQGGAVIVPHYWAETKSPFSIKDLSKAGVDGFEIAGNANVPLTYQTQQELINLCRDKKLVMLSGTNWHGWGNFCNAWTSFNIPNWKQMDMDAREKAVLDALRNRETSRFRVLGYKQQFPVEKNYILEPFTGFLSYFTSLNIWQELSWVFWIAVIYLLIKHIKTRRLAAVILWELISIVLLIEAVLVLNTWETVKDVNQILSEIGKALIALTLITSFLSVTNLINPKK